MFSRSNTFYVGEKNNWFPKYGTNNLKPKNGVNFSIKINISCFLEIKKNSGQQWDNNLSSELKIHQVIYRIFWKQTKVDNFLNPFYCSREARSSRNDDWLTIWRMSIFKEYLILLTIILGVIGDGWRGLIKRHSWFMCEWKNLCLYLIFAINYFPSRVLPKREYFLHTHTKLVGEDILS